MVKAISSVEGAHVVVGDAHFQWQFPIGPDTEGRLPVAKLAGMLGDYEELCRTLEPRRIVELGVHLGGSTAFLNELAEPERIVAVELNATPAEALSDYVAGRGLEEVVRTHYGVDQGDRAQLRRIVHDEFGGEPLDLVIDDASHLYAETLSSFDTLFPLLRPGGAYVIEDWTAGNEILQHLAAALEHPTPEQAARIGELLAMPDAERRLPFVPLTRLAHEVLLVRTMPNDLFRSVTVTRYWTVVRRGDDPVDPETFRLQDSYEDRFGFAGPGPADVPIEGA